MRWSPQSTLTLQLHDHRAPLVQRSLYKYKCCRRWGARVGIQVFMRELHTHILLDQVIVEILSCIKKKKKTLQLHAFSPSASFAYKGPVHGTPKLNNDLHVPPNNNEASHTNQLCFSISLRCFYFFSNLVETEKIYMLILIPNPMYIDANQ